jgi:putative esterase
MLIFAALSVLYNSPLRVVAAPPPAPRIIAQFDRSLGELHGRVLVFLTKTAPKKNEPVEPGSFEPRSVEIFGTEVDAPAGAAVEVPVNADAYPTALRDVAAGRYTARAELDVHHRYTYDGYQSGDPTSANVAVRIAPGAVTTIVVRRRRGPDEPLPAPAPADPGRMETFVSPSLSAFFGRPTTLRAFVQPPTGYATSGRRYATVYNIGGFGSTDRVLPFNARAARAFFARSGGTQLIYVYLDPHVPLGHGVFADSVNNGPLGRALTAELIPYLESRWRMTATEGTRFLTGHSSGGWTAMWLQVTYPSVFGGTWSTSPDPLDFHDFTGPNLVDDPAGNFYRSRSGRPYMLVRVKGKDVVTMRDFVLQERALGSYGGQFGSRRGLLTARRRRPPAAAVRPLDGPHRSKRGPILGSALRHRAHLA